MNRDFVCFGELQYKELIGKTLTIDKLNEFTKALEYKYFKDLCIDYEDRFDYFTFSFNMLTNEELEEKLEENKINDDFSGNFLFDVINYCPSDYVLALWCIANEDKTFKINSISIDS